jgi:hypothetical protein
VARGSIQPTQKEDDRLLCLTCEAEFVLTDRSSHKWQVLVAVPFALDGNGIASGICPGCARLPGIDKKILEKLRHGAFGGDLMLPASQGAEQRH